jgi:hypothetical protein
MTNGRERTRDWRDRLDMNERVTWGVKYDFKCPSLGVTYWATTGWPCTSESHARIIAHSLREAGTPMSKALRDMKTRNVELMQKVGGEWMRVQRWL